MIVRIVVGVLAAAVLFAHPTEARAHACDRTDNDRREASRVIRNLTQEIDAMERAIIEALRLQTGQLSGYTAQSARAITGALDSQTRLQAQIAREAAETEAMRARRPARGACEGITGLAGLAATGAASADARAGAAATETGRIIGDRAVVDRPGAAAGDAARFETLTKSYCNAGRAGEDPDLCRGADERKRCERTTYHIYKECGLLTLSPRRVSRCRILSEATAPIGIGRTRRPPSRARTRKHPPSRRRRSAGAPMRRRGSCARASGLGNG